MRLTTLLVGLIPSIASATIIASLESCKSTAHAQNVVAPASSALPNTTAPNATSDQQLPSARKHRDLAPLGFAPSGSAVVARLTRSQPDNGDVQATINDGVPHPQTPGHEALPASIPTPLPRTSARNMDLPAIGEPVPAREVPTVTLDDVARMALASSPNIREAAARVAATRGRAQQVGLYPNPTINGASPQWNGSSSQYNGFLTQEFVTMGKLRLNREALMREVQQAELRYTRIRFDLLTAIRSGFYSTLVGQQRVQVLTELVDIANTSLVTAERLKRGGEASDLDVLFFRIEHDRARMGLVNAEALLAAARRRLAASMGIPELDLPRVAAQVDAALPDYQYVALRQGVVTVNALAQIAEVEVNKNRILLQRAIVEPWPNIVAMGGYQYQVNAPPLSQGLFQFTMSVPVFNRNQGNIRAARADIGAASQQAARVQNELSGQAALALGNFSVAQQQVAFFERDILPRAAEILQISKQAYANGHFDFLRLLQSQRTLLESRISYVNAQEARWTAAAELAGLLQVEQFP